MLPRIEITMHGSRSALIRIHLYWRRKGLQDIDVAVNGVDTMCVDLSGSIFSLVRFCGESQQLHPFQLLEAKRVIPGPMKM